MQVCFLSLRRPHFSAIFSPVFRKYYARVQIQPEPGRSLAPDISEHPPI